MLLPFFFFFYFFKKLFKQENSENALFSMHPFHYAFWFDFFFFVPEVDKLWQTSYNLTGLESRQVFLPSIYSTCICVYATPNL